MTKEMIKAFSTATALCQNTVALAEILQRFQVACILKENRAEAGMVYYILPYEGACKRKWEYPNYFTFEELCEFQKKVKSSHYLHEREIIIEGAEALLAKGNTWEEVKDILLQYLTYNTEEGWFCRGLSFAF